MERLHIHWAMAGTCLLLGAPFCGAVGAASLIPLEPMAPAETVIPTEPLAPIETVIPTDPMAPAETVIPAETKPPTCRPELQPDASCRLGFRTDQVCYRGGTVVSRKIGPCVVETPPRPPKPPKPPKPVEPPKVPE